MKSLSACIHPSLQSRLANLGVHTHGITTLHSPNYIAPTLASRPPEPDVRRAGSPSDALPFTSSPPVLPPRPCGALDGYLQPATTAPLSQSSVRLKARKQSQRPITSPAPPLTMLRVILINFCESKHSKESIIPKYLQEGYNIILCQDLNPPAQVPILFALGTDCVRIHHNTTGRARGAAVVVGPSLSRYSQPLPAFKETHGLLATCTVTPPGLPTLTIPSVYCPPHRPTDAALHGDVLEALLPRLAAKYPLHLLGGYFNAVVYPSMDSECLTNDHTWNWLTGQASTCPPKLVDSYRHLHHHSRVFTPYRTEYWNSLARLHYIFAFLDMHRALPIKEASVLGDHTFFDHHSGPASLQIPSFIPLPTPPPPPRTHGVPCPGAPKKWKG